MYILGINSVYHESAACLLRDGRVIAAAEEERFNRVKHGKRPRADNADELPLHSIAYCVKSEGIDWGQIDYVGYSVNPQKYQQHPPDMFFDGPNWDEAQFLHKLSLIPEQLRACGFKGEFLWIDHHAAHAASAFYASPFQRAAVLAIDGIGEFDTTTVYLGEGNRLECLSSIEYPHSLGFLWESLSMFLGFDIYDAAKVMGLAGYGTPAKYATHFQTLVQLMPEGRFQVNNDILRFEHIQYDPPNGYMDGLENLFRLDRRTRQQPLTREHQDIAASLQAVTNEVVLHIVKALHARTGGDTLCLAGGVALNCLTNYYALENGPFAQLYVQPAAHDGGTAVGAAYYIWSHLLGNPDREPMSHAYWGPAFSDAAIEQRLQAYSLRYEGVPNIEERVARLVNQGDIVGFFQGSMELGPRALGNRSIVADPRHPKMRDMLNQKVKHREYFRPLAPSVLHEEAHDWFEMGKETCAAECMLMTYPTRPQVKDRIPAVVHVDGSSRIQTVRQEINPRYHKLLSEFYKLSGVPLVLNTSFNDSEPIICTPDDAINTFLKTGIDHLAIGNFLVSKNSHGSE